MTPPPALHALVFGTPTAPRERVVRVLSRLFPESRMIERSEADLAAQDLERSIYDLVVLVVKESPEQLGPILERLASHRTPMPVCLLVHTSMQEELLRCSVPVHPEWEIALYDASTDEFLGRTLRQAIRRHELRWERDHLERAFQSSILQYRNLFDEVPDLIFLCDRSGCLLDLNATVARVFGIERDDVLHKTIFEAFGMEAGVFQELIALATRGQGPIVDLEVEFRPANGRVIHGLTHMIARRDGPNRPIQFQGVIKDISHRKDLESQLRDHSRQLETKVAERTRELTDTMNFLNGILEGATEYAIFGLDESGTFVHFNRGAQLILNYDPDEMVGRRRLDHVLQFDDSEIGSLEELLRAVDAYGVLMREMLVRTGNDRRIVMHMTLNRLREADSGNLIYVGIARDVTEQKELEDLLKVYTENLENVLEEKSQQLEQKHIELIQSSKLATLGEMATGIAHEMNQPLSGIRTRAQLLSRLVGKGALDAEKVLAGQKEIIALVDRISRIIHHMRVFARQDQQPFGAFYLVQSIDGCLSLLSEQLRLHAIDVRLSIQRDVPEVIGEPSQIEQVLLNLVSNARDAMDEKEAKLVGDEARGRYRKQLQIGLERQGNHEARLWVSDNGIGMNETVQERIFQPFWTTKSIGKGTGLGLSISYGIIAKHSGRIEVESTPGQGTTFSVYLPMVRGGRPRRVAESALPTEPVRKSA